MTTLLLLRDAKGKVVSRCNEKCYDATTPDCDCICRGRNHGKGLDKAVKNLTDFVCGCQVPYLPADHERQTRLCRGRDYPEMKQLHLF